MKKLLFLLLLFNYSYGQTTIANKLKITNPSELSTNTQIVTRGTSTGETGYILKTDVQDVLKYASAAVLPLTGEAGKFYYTIDDKKYYTWNGSYYDEFGVGGGGASVSDTAYDATSWNGVTTIAPSKNAVRDKIEALDSAKQDALGFTPYNATNPSGYISSYTETDPLALKIANNLSDLTNTSTARTNLGLGTLATQSGTFTDKVDGNTAITGATKTKITYDTKGLITAGADATQDDITDGSTNRSFTNTEKTKLSGIATGATANDTDANLKNRANHTGTQTASTISDFNTAADARVVAGITGKQDALTLTTTGSGAATLTGATLNIPTPSSSGDMVLASTQTNSGLKTFLDGTFGLRNVANTFTSLFTNTNTAARTYTLPNTTGTIALISDVVAGSSLVPLDEGGGIGHVINGRTAANYGSIGLNAVDLSYSDAASSVRGATNTYAFASGFATRASGQQAAAFNGGTIASGTQAFASGNTTTASAQGAMATGGFTTASGGYSLAVNNSNTASGDASLVGGVNNTSKSYAETVLGINGTSYTPTSATAYSSTDRAFSVGVGASSGARADGIIILKNGLATLPSVTNTLIAAGSGKEIVTLEYLNAKATTGQIIVTSGTSFTTPSTITTATVFNIELVGAGGGGGGSGSTTSVASGGGAGGYVFKRITGLSPSATYTCSIGTGGTGGAYNTVGNAGTDTTLTIGGTTYTASGGGGGNTAAGSAGGTAGTGTNGDINITGQKGQIALGSGVATAAGASGGNSPKGWGYGAQGVYTPSNGDNGSGYGAGGGGAKGATGSPTGGNGTNGIIFCQWFN